MPRTGLPIARLSAIGLGQQPATLVVADRLNSDANLTGQLANRECLYRPLPLLSIGCFAPALLRLRSGPRYSSREIAKRFLTSWVTATEYRLSTGRRSAGATKQQRERGTEQNERNSSLAHQENAESSVRAATNCLLRLLDDWTAGKTPQKPVCFRGLQIAILKGLASL